MHAPTENAPRLFRRRTLLSPAQVTGIGLFTDAPVTLRMLPATAPGTQPGIWFRRDDLPGTPLIPALVRFVVPERRRTVLACGPGPGSPAVQTVEHVLAALAGLGITDALVTLDGPEAPIGDGSAAPFVRALVAAGTVELGAPGFPPLVIHREVRVGTHDAGVTALPGPPDCLDLRYELDYGPGSPIPPQVGRLTMQHGLPPADFAARVAPARTFCLAHEAQSLRAAGLFKSFSPRDLLVFGPDGPIDNGLRTPDEPALHKLLDLLGDLSLVGRPIEGVVVARRSGHELNQQMAAALVAASDGAHE